MNIRARVLAAYGNHCAFCQTTDVPLEIDHIHGQGNVHRRQIGIKLHVWLARQHAATGAWPLGFQLLCTQCHNRKSGRIPSMPSREGFTQHNISLTDAVTAQLTFLAAQHDGSKSKVVELALRTLVEGDFAKTALAGVQDQLASEADVIKHALEDLGERVSKVTNAVQLITQRMQALEDENQRRYATLVQAFDRLKGGAEKPSHGLFRTFTQRTSR